MYRIKLVLAAALTLPAFLLMAQPGTNDKAGATTDDPTVPVTTDIGNSDDGEGNSSKAAERNTSPTVRDDYQPRERISEDGGVSFPADI